MSAAGTWTLIVTVLGSTMAAANSAGSTIRWARYPSAWTFTAYRLARLKAVLASGPGSKIRSSDLADAHHVSCGPYVDVIVSDDGGLLSTFNQFADQVGFRVISSSEFNAEFELAPPSEGAAAVR